MDIRTAKVDSKRICGQLKWTARNLFVWHIYMFSKKNKFESITGLGWVQFPSSLAYNFGRTSATVAWNMRFLDIILCHPQIWKKKAAIMKPSLNYLVRSVLWQLYCSHFFASLYMNLVSSLIMNLPKRNESNIFSIRTEEPSSIKYIASTLNRLESTLFRGGSLPRQHCFMSVKDFLDQYLVAFWAKNNISWYARNRERGF